MGIDNDDLQIWHILETYPPGYGGGAAITTRDVCRALAARGHDVRVLCADCIDAEPYSIRCEDDQGVRVERVNLPFIARDPDGWLFSKSEWQSHGRRIDELIGKLLEQWRPDIVDYHTSRPFGEQCLIALGGRGVPAVATLHDAWLVCPRVMLLRSPDSSACDGPGRLKCLECSYSYYDGSHARAMLKLPWRVLKLGAYPAWRLKQRERARRRLIGAIARSEFMAEVHRPHIGGVVEHIPLGLNLADLPECKPARPRTPLRFGFIGGFQPGKGIVHVLDAAAVLRGEGLRFELHIWGPGCEGRESEISSRGLNGCAFLRGMYAPEQCWSVYGEMDVALMATLVNEPFGRVPLEAAAMRAPTIAPAVGGIRETIRDGVDGLHYRFRDGEDLTRQMRRILTETGLLEKLMANLSPPLDTRAQAVEVERFYYRVLSSTLAIFDL
ncbi:MAG: glycosyltransferase [Blastocatellales bacterium]|nr:glycosyltransferase [Blastocatellales bacterium]